MPDYVNVTLSLTVHRDDQELAVGVATQGLQAAVANIPDLVSGNIAIFGDDFAQEQANAKSAEDGVSTFPTAPVESADTLDEIR